MLQWARRVEELGAGEILLTSVDREGTGSGFDTELTALVSQAVSIPVIASGGAGSLEHIGQAVQEGCADAVAVASVLHYDCIKGQSTGGEVKDEGNREFLKSGKSFSKVTPAGLQEIKGYLCRQGIVCRYAANLECA